MKAAKLIANKKIQCIDTPTPEITSDTDVLIRVKTVGVCGSDVHYFTTGKIGSLVVDYPFTLGHEGAGIVEKIGSGVTSVKPGDKIAIEPSLSCGECGQCKAGRPHTCLNNKFLGCPGQLEGNLSEYLLMPESQCIKLQEGMDFEDGALSEPLSIGLYANKLAGYKAGSSIAILGFGPIGMSVLLTSKATIPGRYYVSDKIDERLVLANKSGVELTANPLNTEVSRKIKTMESEGVDVVFECCGQQEALDTAMELVKPGGKVMIVGIPEFDDWKFQADLARRKEISIVHVRRQNNCVHEVLELMAKGKIDASPMATHRFTLAETQEAFELASNYHDGVMKAMIML